MNTIALKNLPAAENNSACEKQVDAPPGKVVLRLGEIDLLADVVADVPPTVTEENKPAPTGGGKKLPKPMIEFYSPSQLRNYVIPAGQNMVGDSHIQRGAPTVLAGPPGCGKSRATLWLGVLGAIGSGNWFGMPIHTKFRTLIIQSENGLSRLHRDFQQIQDVPDLDDWLRVSAFPSYRGFQFDNPFFRAELKAAVRDFQPQLVIVDPWNAVVKDAMEKDFLEGFERVREVMAEVPDAACLILHHLRKPRADDRHRGRNLTNLLSGSYVLVSMARSVLVMQPATDDTEDARVIITPSKNNDGELGARSVWERKTGWFDPVKDFNWEEFDAGTAKREPKVQEEHLREVFADGKNWMTQTRAKDLLMECAKVCRSAAYDALKVVNGRFSNLLTKRDDGLIGLRVVSPADDGEPG